MSRVSSNQVWVLLIACLLVSALVSLAAVLIAVQRPLVVVVQQAPAAGASPAGAPGVANATLSQPATGTSAAAPAEAPPSTTVTAVRVPALPGLDDPFDPAWSAVPVIDLAMQAQQVTAPILDQVTVAHLQVQAARDAGRIAWRLSWPAPQPSSNVETSTFTDAVAMQFPLAPGTPFTMGAKGKPVRVLHWKALWQKDIDEGFQDVHVLYPNAHSDLYWFAEGKWPFPVTEAFKDVRSRQWLVGNAAGNPMSKLDRTTPVEELVAEGFGSTTTDPDSPSKARGRWKDGRWTVVIDRPLSADDPLSAVLQPGRDSQVAFAVWDGQAGNVSGRKQWVGWVPFKVEP